MFENELLTLKEKLPQNSCRPATEPAYDAMSDAFVWNDELVEFKNLSTGEMGALRALWRFRTSLITGIADNRFQDVWANFRTIAPDWIGFTTDRTIYSEALATEYKNHKRRKGRGAHSGNP